MQIKLRKVLAVLSAVLMLCTMLPMGVFTMSVSAATNLVTNGDFENGNTTGWSGGLSASADAAHDGTYGATATATASWGSLLKQTVSLEANSYYYISYWYKSNADAATVASFELKYKGNSGSETKIKFLNTGSTSQGMKTTVTDWTQVQLYFATGDDNYATTNLLFYRGASGAGTPASISIDSIVLCKLDNMLTNGGFETGDFTGWEQKYSSDSAITSENVATGSYALEGTRTDKYGIFLSQTLTVEANTDYHVFFKAKLAASGGQARFYAGPNRGNTGALNTTYTFSATADAWTDFKFSFNSGSNTSLYFCPAQGVTNGGNVYFDDIVVLTAPVIDTDEPEPDEPTVKPDVPTDFGIVDNGGFEDATGGWTIKYANRTTEDSYSGDYSLKTTSLIKYGVFAFTDIAVVPNSDYTISFKLKVASMGTANNFRLYTRETSANDSGTTSVPQWYITDATTEWKSYSKVVNSQELSTMYLSFAQGGDEKYYTCSSYYIDDIIVTGPVPEAGGDEPETPESDGYIINGDLETGAVSPWQKFGGSSRVPAVVTDSHSGSYAMSIPYSVRQLSAGQDVTVKADTNYTVTFWYKSTSTAADASVDKTMWFGAYTTDVIEATGSNDLSANPALLDYTKAEWTQATYVFNSGSNTTVRLSFSGSASSNPTTRQFIYVDDIVMVEGGEIPSEPEGYVGAHPQTMTSGADIRFMTYNVLVGKDEANGGFSWGTAIGTRPEKACAMINYYKPDVIALQEFSGEWYDYFAANLSDYELTYTQSQDSQNSGRLYTTMVYNKNVLELVSTELHPLTKTYWGKQGMRYVNVAIFKVKATGEQFIACSVHTDAGNLLTSTSSSDKDVDGDGEKDPQGYWRPEQMEEIAQILSDLSNEHKLPLISGGDYNCDAVGAHYEDTVSYGKVTDAGFVDSTDGKAKDHIFYNGMATHLYNGVVKDAAVSGASDHDAIFADIQFLDEFATPIKDAKDYIKTQGRNTLKDGALWLDFSASGIEFSANCEGKVALNLNVKSLKQTDSYGGLYFTVIVDGVKKDRAQCHITSTGNVELVLAEDLPAGNHTFEVYRQTEHRGAEVGISSIVMNGSFNEKPADNRLYIEFIGDSISTGFGALGTSSDSDGGSPKWQDATVAYPYLTAKALNADFSDVAYSGIGAKYGWQDPNMLNFYPYQRWQYDHTTQYNFNARQPDVVVIALGTNDISKGPEGDTAARKAGYQEMLDMVRAKNPNSKIVWIYGMMKDDDNAMIASLMEENGGAAAGLYSLELVTNTAGAGYHPSAAGQQKFADDLVAFLNSDVLVKYVGDEMLDNDEGDVIDYKGSSRMEMTSNKLGLAFAFGLNIEGLEIANGTEAVLDNATVDAFGDGNQYKLVRMGAIVSNDAVVGLSDMKMADVDNKQTIDINAKYLFDLEGTYAQFAVRITNIPVGFEDAIMYARAYFVIEYEGREVIVYDDTQFANYINKYEQNDGVLEW